MVIDPCELSPSYVRSIAPYQPGKPISEVARELGLKEENIVKLASNENPRGIGPRTRAAIERALGEIARYPDGNGHDLKVALSRRYGVDMAAIVLGNGSNDVLELVAHAFLGPGRAAVYAQHCFAVYPLATQARGARGIAVPAKNYGHDLDAMAAAIDDETYVVWIANPNNPTGTLLASDALEAFVKRVPELALVAATAALDDMEFVARSFAANLQGMRQIEDGAKQLGLEWIPSHGNFITLRVGKANEIFRRLLKRGVIVRPVGGAYQLPEHLRVTIGTAAENERFLSALAASLKD